MGLERFLPMGIAIGPLMRLIMCITRGLRREEKSLKADIMALEERSKTLPSDQVKIEIPGDLILLVSVSGMRFDYTSIVCFDEPNEGEQ